MTTARIPLPLSGLDDRDGMAIDPLNAADLRDIRTLRERVERAPGTTLFAPQPLPSGGGPGSGWSVGTFIGPTATGNQTVSHSLGATPVALILWTARANAANTVETHHHGSVGFTDGTTSKSVSHASHDAQATSQCARRRANALLTVVDWDQTTLAEAAWVSWSSANFVINWTTAFTSTRQIHYIAFGHATASANVLEWSLNTGTGNQAVTGTGINGADVVFHIHDGQTGTGAASHALLGWGAMTASGEFCLSDMAKDNAGTAVTFRSHHTDRSIALYTTSGAEDYAASYVSMDANGFTMNVTNGASGAVKIASLSLKGFQTVKVGRFDKTITAAPVTQAVTGVGFDPVALLLATRWGPASSPTDSDVRMSWGAADSASSWAVAYSDDEGVTKTDVNCIDRNDALLADLDENPPTPPGGTPTVQGSLQSLDSGGFTLNWTRNDIHPRNISYFAGSFATTAGGVIGTPRNYAQAQLATAEKVIMLTDKSAFIYNQATGLFDPTSEAYSLALPARFSIANTQDIVAWSGPGDWLTAGPAPTIRQYDGASFGPLITTPPTTIGANIGARTLLAFNDRIIAVYTRYDPAGGTSYVDQPNEVRWCRSGEVNNWDSATGSAGLLEILETSNAPLTGGFVLGERCYLTKRREIIELIATGTPAPVHRQETRVRGMGMIATHSVGLGEYFAFFLGADDVYRWDGSELAPVGAGIYKTLTQLIDYNNLDQIQGVVHTSDSEYWLLLGTGDIFIYDYRRDRWFRDNRSNIAAIGIVQIGPNVTTDIDASEFVILGHDDARSFRVDQTSSTFLGMAIDSYFVTKDFEAQKLSRKSGQVSGTASYLNAVYELRLHGTPAQTVEVAASRDRGSTWDFTQTVTISDDGVGAAFFELSCAYVRFRVRKYDDQPLELYGAMAYEWEEAGHNLA